MPPSGKMARVAGEKAPTPLTAALAEIDQHLASGGWDQPTKLFALVKAIDLARAEPELAKRLDLSTEPGDDALAAVEQESSDKPLDEWLATIAWPESVDGCAVAQEVVTLPPSAENEMPDGEEPTRWAASHPRKRELRMVVGVLRDGSRSSILRIRNTKNEPDDVITGDALVPNLADALVATFES